MWFTPLLLGGGALSASTIGRPVSDITTTGWSGVPNASLYLNINEVVASDTQYIVSPNLNATPGPAVFGIAPTQVSGTYNANIRARYTTGAGDIRVLLLDSSGATVGTSAWQTLTGTFATYSLSVTTTGIAMRVRIEVQ